MKYTKEQLQEALNYFIRFIDINKSVINYTPLRFIIARDLIKKELEKGDN